MRPCAASPHPARLRDRASLPSTLETFSRQEDTGQFPERKEKYYFLSALNLQTIPQVFKAKPVAMPLQCDSGPLSLEAAGLLKGYNCGFRFYTRKIETMGPLSSLSYYMYKMWN